MTIGKIGLLHSTKFTDEQKAALQRGLTDNNWPASKVKLLNQRVDTEGQYGRNHTELEDEGKHHHTGNAVDVIVAAGGVVSAKAASQAMSALGVKKPIVYLIGRLPKAANEDGHKELTQDPNVVGGVDLATTKGNDARRDELVKQFKVPAGTVALLVNTNSSMWAPEIDEWRSFGQSIYLKYPDLIGAKENDYTNFDDFFRAVANLAQVPSAIVLSSDPFFFRFRSWIMKAAKNEFNVPICFAFEEYKNSQEWNSKKHIVVGNKLLDAYYQLGVKAAASLTHIFPLPLGTETFELPSEP
jgi:hypothetical protein